MWSLLLRFYWLLLHLLSSQVLENLLCHVTSRVAESVGMRTALSLVKGSPSNQLEHVLLCHGVAASVWRTARCITWSTRWSSSLRLLVRRMLNLCLWHLLPCIGLLLWSHGSKSCLCFWSHLLPLVQLHLLNLFKYAAWISRWVILI